MKIPSTHRHFVYSHACDYPRMYMYIHTHIQINKCHAHAHAKTSPLLSNICALYLVKSNTQNNGRQGELLWAIKQHSNWQYCAGFWDSNSKVAKYDYICLRALYNHNSLSGNGNESANALERNEKYCARITKIRGHNQYNHTNHSFLQFVMHPAPSPILRLFHIRSM